ncbi:MAG TPA: NAD(P)-dependent oxidoreductase [Solirubrobacteraceae bacterium]|nr:NAD(P)-dependent oxidoreductase [Solirubrobacteraceae bacterium]
MLAWVSGEGLREALEPAPVGMELAVVPRDAAQAPDVDRVEVLVPAAAPDRLGDLLPRMGGLRLIQVLSAGVDWIEGLVPEGVTLCNARGSRDVAVAEWVLAAMLHHAQDLVRADDQRRDGVWEPWSPREVAGSTVLIVGHGAIGRALEQRLTAMEAEVIGFARRARAGVRGLEELGELLPRADVVVLLAPLTEQSRHLADSAFLEAMRPGALLVNAGRGALVDTDALVAALDAGRLRAALDVTEPEPLPSGHRLWRAPGLLLTPHHAGDTPQAHARAVAIVRDQLGRYARGEPLANVVGG